MLARRGEVYALSVVRKIRDFATFVHRRDGKDIVQIESGGIRRKPVGIRAVVARRADEQRRALGYGVAQKHRFGGRSPTAIYDFNSLRGRVLNRLNGVKNIAFVANGKRRNASGVFLSPQSITLCGGPIYDSIILQTLGKGQKKFESVLPPAFSENAQPKRRHVLDASDERDSVGFASRERAPVGLGNALNCFHFVI
jgi:hypothetical protein